MSEQEILHKREYFDTTEVNEELLNNDEELIFQHKKALHKKINDLLTKTKNTNV